MKRVEISTYRRITTCVQKVGLITNTKYENQFSNMKGSVYIGFLLLFPCLSNAASLGSHLEAKVSFFGQCSDQ